MTTIWNLPRIDLSAITSIQESRPTALLTGRKSWQTVGPLFNLPLVVQAEPHSSERRYIDSLAEGLPPQVEVVYGVGGGMVCDVAKYVGWKRSLPVVLVPTALSVDGFFTPIVAVRENGVIDYETTGPARQVIIDWEVVRTAPAELRGAGITEILSIVTGLLDWRYAAERNQNTPETRFQQWAAALAAGIAQQAFKIAKGVGEGRVEALRELLDLICMEVQLTNQLGHTRPQEGSEQFFATAIEPLVTRAGRVTYADLVGPGILIAAALHGQDVAAIRQTIASAGVRLGQLRPVDVMDTLRMLPQYVKMHSLPYTILNDFQPTTEKIQEVLRTIGMGEV